MNEPFLPPDDDVTTADDFTVSELRTVAWVLQRLRLGEKLNHIADRLPHWAARFKLTALSRLLDRWEKYTGGQLFARAKTRGGPLELTTTGLDRFDDMVRAIDRMVGLYQSLRPGEVVERVRVGSYTSHIAQVMVPVCRWLGAERPRVVVEFNTAHQTEVLAWLRAKLIDVAVLEYEPGYAVADVLDPVVVRAADRDVVCEELPYGTELGLTFHTRMPGCERLLPLADRGGAAPAATMPWAEVMEVLAKVPVALAQPNQHVDRSNNFDGWLVREFIPEPGAADGRAAPRAARFLVPLYRVVRVLVRQRLAVGFGTRPWPKDATSAEIEFVPLDRFEGFAPPTGGGGAHGRGHVFAVYARRADLLGDPGGLPRATLDFIRAVRGVCRNDPPYYTDADRNEEWLRFEQTPDGPRLLHDLCR